MQSDMNLPHQEEQVIVIGAGPAGLMAAEQICGRGYQVDVFDAMPSIGRKFLYAGKSGLNITHNEEFDFFRQRYRCNSHLFDTTIQKFSPTDVKDWVHALGIETFVGSSGRVFPKEMKAAPLLRAWISRLREKGVRFHMRHKWIGWRAGAHVFQTENAEVLLMPTATIFALGGGSWKRLGSDASWVPVFEQHDIRIKALTPSNCGFEIAWSEHLKSKFAGQALSNVIVSLPSVNGAIFQKQGQFVISEYGIEGSLIYAVSHEILHSLLKEGSCVIKLDLLPGRDLDRVTRELSNSRGSKSVSSHLKSKLGLSSLAIGLIYECLSPDAMNDTLRLAESIKALPIKVIRARPIDEAISTSGGVSFDALDNNFMLTAQPGNFCCGEMLDWDAPTGGYLLTACLATGRATGLGVVNWLEVR